MLAASIMIGVCAAIAVFVVRMKASKKPATIKKILLPPVLMSTGFFMFILPACRVGYDTALRAFFIGCLFSIFLIWTSRFEIHNNQIYLKRSKAFIFILLGLLTVRTVMKYYVGGEVSIMESGGYFFILAFGMILPWRVGMFIGYKRQEKKLNEIVTVS